MKNIIMKTIIFAFAVAISFIMFACGNGEPVVFDAPKGVPYEGLFIIDKMNSTTSYSYINGKNEFKVKLQWRTKDENIELAEFTDEYFLEWSAEANVLYVPCKPIKDMSLLRNNKYIIKPGEDKEIMFDIDSYFDGLPIGYYRFVKVFDVKYKDGSVKQMVASFDLEIV